jgi:hypothetical protein
MISLPKNDLLSEHDFVIGAIPFLGDLFDFAWKANRKNARLLEQHLHDQTARTSDQRNYRRRQPP